MIYKLLGGLRGGLASATIIASTILAAMVGVIGTAEVTMGILALPAMLKRGYDPRLACGSILVINFAVVAQQSVDELFIGAVFPGLILSGLYILYVTARCYIDPEMDPSLPLEQRVDLRGKMLLLKGIIAPIALIVLVLGVIFTGIATFGALFGAAVHRRLNWQAIREAAITTLKASAMVLWIIFGASIFVGFYILQGGQQFVSDALIGTGLGAYGILLIMMVVLIIVGMFLDWVGILVLAVPIFVPLMKTLSFDGLLGLPGVAPSDIPLWFGVV